MSTRIDKPKIYKRINGKVVRVVKPKDDWCGDNRTDWVVTNKQVQPKDYLHPVNYNSIHERKGVSKV